MLAAFAIDVHKLDLDLDELGIDELRDRTARRPIEVEVFAAKEEEHGPEVHAPGLERNLMLKHPRRRSWKDHLLALDHLKEGINLRGYGQKDPLNEYKRESFELFAEMKTRFEDSVVKNLFRVEPVSEEELAERRRRMVEQMKSRLPLLGAGQGLGPDQAAERSSARTARWGATNPAPAARVRSTRSATGRVRCDRTRMSSRPELDIETRLIETPQLLAEACREWRQLEAIGVDTEFVRERTFYAALGLIQISAAGATALIDTVAIEDLEPLARILRDEDVIKVFHSCGEDLEVLYHRFGEFPQNVFDTQIAAAFAGRGAALGYGKLVATMFGVDLPKDKTRTNWLKRPLSEAQKRYAALDVAFLLPAYTRLRAELRRFGREAWAREELEPLFDAERFLPDPEDAYRRIRAHRSLPPRALAILARLATWRERQARRRNLPRNFVVREKALVDIARRAPRSRSALVAIDSLHPRERERHGRALLQRVAEAKRRPADELPVAHRQFDLRPYRRLVERLRGLVGELAEELSLPPELLANRRTVEMLVRRSVTGREPTLPRELHGWRREVVGEPLLAAIGSAAPA